MFIIYVAICKISFTYPRKPITYLQSRTELCGALLRNSKERGTSTACPSARRASVCFLVQIKLRNSCMVCNDEILPLIRPYTYYTKYNKYMYLKKECFHRYHENFHRIDMKR
jgi:hypothetical protein